MGEHKDERWSTSSDDVTTEEPEALDASEEEADEPQDTHTVPQPTSVAPAGTVTPDKSKSDFEVKDPYKGYSHVAGKPATGNAEKSDNDGE